MFEFIKKMFIAAIGIIGLNVVNPVKCVSTNNQECKITPVIMNINSNEPLFYPYSILVNKSSGSRNDINNLYAELCVTDVVKTWISNYLI